MQPARLQFIACSPLRITRIRVMFLTENLKHLLSASIAFDRSNALGLSPNPYTDKKSKSKRISFLLFLLCLFFMNELMLTHHELALPWILASLHELNCNQCAVRHNSCRRQFTKARLSIHATARLQFIACSPLRITRIFFGSFFISFYW